MKITRLETMLVQPRWCFLKIHTDAGIVGYGEPIVEGHHDAVAQEVQQIGEYLVGQDPRRIEHHWQAIYRHGFYRGGPVLTSALSGGCPVGHPRQSLGVPIQRGRCLSRPIRVYSLRRRHARNTHSAKAAAVAASPR